MKAYPTYAQIDEAYYYLGLEHELAGDLINARRSYYELIKNAPASRFVPYAYFAFGEVFFHEAKSDPSKWDLAKQSYVEVMKFASRRSRATRRAGSRWCTTHRATPITRR